VSPLPIPPDWTPEFPGQRPPFEKGNQWVALPGNEKALKHGAFSSHVAPIAERIMAAILKDDDVAFLQLPRFDGALRRYVKSAARVELLEAWVDSMPLEESSRSDKGQTSPMELLRKWKTTADNEAGKLGLDAVSWARIRKDYNAGTKLDIATILSKTRADGELTEREQEQMTRWGLTGNGE
jgi:hypothetical protein